MSLKKISLLLIIVLGLYSCSQKAEDVIEKNMNARGGAENLRNIKSVFADGKASTMGFDIPMKMLFVAPDKMWFNMSLMGKEITTVTNGSQAWVKSDTVVQLMPKEQAEDLKSQMKSQLSFFQTNLVNFKEMGYKVELMPKEKLDGKDVIKIKVTTKDSSIMFVYIDPSSYLDIKVTNKIKDKMSGMMSEQDTYFKDYKKVGNMQMPHLVEIKTNGKVIAKMVFSSVKINEQVDNTLFVVPANAQEMLTQKMQ